MESVEARGAVILALAREVLDDIELSRLPGEGIVLKASRLARLVEAAEVTEWLGYELLGYPDPTHSPVASKYLSRTGRVRAAVGALPGMTYYGPLAVQEAAAAAQRIKLQAFRVPDVSYSIASANPMQYVGPPTFGNPVQQPVDAVLSAAQVTANELIFVSGIRSRVLGLLHSWVTGLYHERLFSGVAATIFDQFKQTTDSALALRCGDALAKLPQVYERLAQGDAEAVSHAMTTCRRVLDALADSVYPPSAAIERGGTMIELTEKHSKNRLREYLRERVLSETRLDRLNHTVADLYGRFSTGVHADVNLDEAKALLVSAYVFVGEVLSLPELPSMSSPAGERTA